MNNLPIESLDFDGIKENLKTYLKNTGKFNDFNFEASGISTIINLLSYNTHYIGYYTKMLLNESFIDSATLRSTLLSKAKLTGYTPKSVRSARATIKITARLNSDEKSIIGNAKLLVKPLTKFLATTEFGEKQFFNFDGYEFNYLYQENGFFVYESPNVVLYEGSLKTENFTVSSNTTNNFVIYNKNIDIDFIKVYVKENINSSLRTEYHRTDTLHNISPDSHVYFITTNDSGYYEIVFGNDVIGKKINVGNYISIVYLATSGTAGNNASVFRISSSPTDNYDFSYYLNNSIRTIDSSSSGRSEESIDELKYNIPKANARQFRLITLSDFESFILNEYRDISSINIYSSETLNRKEFNKIFVSIKPATSRNLSFFAKEEIINKVDKYKFIAAELVFVDPDFIDVSLNLTIKTKHDNIKTKQEIKTQVADTIIEYNKNILNKFNNSYSDIEVLNLVKKNSESIETLFSTKKLALTFNIIHNNTNELILHLYNNKIKPGTVFSDVIHYNNKMCHIKESNSSLFLTENNNIIIKIGSIDYKNNRLIINPITGIRSEIVYNNYDTYKIYFDSIGNDIYSINNYLINIEKLEVDIL